MRSILCVVAQSCPTLYNPMDWQPLGLQPATLLCPWGFSKQEYWSGLICLLPGSSWLGMEPRSPVCRRTFYCLSCQLLINGSWLYRRWVICLLLFPATVGFFPANISVPFLFTWKLSRMQVLSKRKTLAQKELLSGIAVKILSSCQFIQNTGGWVFAFNYNIYLRKNKWLASFCHVWYSINSNFRAVGVHL